MARLLSPLRLTGIVTQGFGRGGKEDRFEKKGNEYHAKVRQAFLQIATGNPNRYHVIDANQSIPVVTQEIFTVLNHHFNINLKVQ